MIARKTYLPFLYKFIDDVNADFTLCFHRQKLEKPFDYPRNDSLKIQNFNSKRSF